MRESTMNRNTGETQLACSVNLDGKGVFDGSTGIGFFDHMLHLLSKHGGFDLNIECKGDLDVDTHHTVEDLGILLGQCLKEALGDKRGIRRYGNFYCPMDEALSRVTLDLSGRGFLVFNVELKREKVGNFETEMLNEFLYAFAINSGTTLHVTTLYGKNDHHIIESIFKALGRALSEACRIEPGSDSIPSTKGIL
ncbi:imidazoleglycerol-phosphate dehydratase HisB [Alkalibacter saccharofermentans]|uniref:Imidazoleglycerol-phosphate dehydratase n=1 Tax=Alkalibacter saccharofermentans DSM 14828 TaxID=1120975 RepID=A0A1M4TAU1_9FIRM|nr:imidazoleglycerol-phosphate dehydratase HisB [Alkalibacter saccharofermentans]SHE41545.1 imidazoleglycerol-phosphate dehydratase [Alkalibacter saccharofermentans DSM 14828]